MKILYKTRLSSLKEKRRRKTSQPAAPARFHDRTIRFEIKRPLAVTEERTCKLHVHVSSVNVKEILKCGFSLFFWYYYFSLFVSCVVLFIPLHFYLTFLVIYTRTKIYWKLLRDSFDCTSAPASLPHLTLWKIYCDSRPESNWKVGNIDWIFIFYCFHIISQQLK